MTHIISSRRYVMIAYDSCLLFDFYRFSSLHLFMFHMFLDLQIGFSSVGMVHCGHAADSFPRISAVATDPTSACPRWADVEQKRAWVP